MEERRARKKKEPKGLSAGQKASLERDKKAKKYETCRECGLKIKSENHNDGLAHKRRKGKV